MLEYMLLLLVSIFLLIGSFANGKGPVEMFRQSGPVAAAHIEQRIIVGSGFFSRGDGREIAWQR